MNTNSKIKTYKSYGEIPKAWALVSLKSGLHTNENFKSRNFKAKDPPYVFLKRFYGLID